MSHIRSPRPDHPESNGVSGTTHNLRVLADGQSPASGLTENVVCKLRGRDFDFRGGPRGNIPPFQFAENVNVVDAMAIANRARALQARELRRLFHAAMDWGVNVAARWRNSTGPHTALNSFIGKLSFRKDGTIAVTSVGAVEQSMDTLRRIAEWMAIQIRLFRRRRAQRHAIDELRRLDDRTLQDIGIDRSQIESVVRGNMEIYRGPYVDSPRRQAER